MEHMRQHAVSHGGSLIGDKLDLVIASEVVGLVRFLLQTSDQEWRDAVNQGLNEALCSPVLKVRVRVRVRVSVRVRVRVRISIRVRVSVRVKVTVTVTVNL